MHTIILSVFPFPILYTIYTIIQHFVHNVFFFLGFFQKTNLGHIFLALHLGNFFKTYLFLFKRHTLQEDRKKQRRSFTLQITRRALQSWANLECQCHLGRGTACCNIVQDTSVFITWIISWDSILFHSGWLWISSDPASPLYHSDHGIPFLENFYEWNPTGELSFQACPHYEIILYCWDLQHVSEFENVKSEQSG